MERLTKKINLSEIIFDEGIYPRKTHNPSKVQEYAENIEAIEQAQNFITVSANFKLLDGRHRHLAYLKNADGKDVEITVYILQDIKDAKDEYLKSIELNSSHGQQLSKDDKRQNCINLYSKFGYSLDTIAKLVCVSKAFALDSTKLIRENEEAKSFETIKDMYLACYSMQEIADKLVSTAPTVLSKIEKLIKNSTSEPNLIRISNFQDDEFEKPIYNIWSFAKKTNDVSHFGNSEVRIVENLLYLYTQPFDIVFDPFAGGGSTIDICKKRLRRYYVSDRKPIVERESEIRKLDIVTDFPAFNNRWQDVKLVYLDPPYWRQAENKYSTDAQDLANMPLNEFNTALASVVNRIAGKLSTGSHIALLIQPTQWKSDNKEFTDHVFDMLRLADGQRLKVINRISCPYSTQQYTPQQVNHAKENKTCLVITRELIIWQVK